MDESAHSEPIVILLVDADPLELATLQRALASPGRQLVAAPTIAAAEACLDAHHVALAIIAIMLPDGDGRNFLLRLREDTQTASVSTIVASGLKNPQVRAECYALGCDLYIDKPVDVDLLTGAVAGLLDRTQRRRRDAQRDPLTRLPSRAAVRDAFATLIARPSHTAMAVASLDLDGFHAVNTRLGSAAADAVLRTFADWLRRGLRLTDVLGRWNGEEFVVLLPDTDDDSAAGVIGALRDQLRTLEVTPDAPELRLSFTAGIAGAPAGTSLDAALAEADRRLYEGKVAGRGAVITARREPRVAPRTVLVAEDDPVIAALVRHRLVRDGFDVIHASNGTEALAKAAEGHIALAILDVNMPGLSGLALLERLRKNPAFARTPIMMLTAMGNEADVTRALALGADDYVVKPFSPVELVARVRRLIART